MPIKFNGTNTAANPSITGDDTDTGIVYGSDQIDFSTGGSSKVTLNGSNLGIGTTSPSGASGKVLEINGGSGQARLVFKNNTTGSASTDGQQIFSDGTTLGIQNREAGSTTFETNGFERMRIQSDGKIGIGRTSPVNFVDIHRGQDEENILVVRGQGLSDEYCALGVNGSNAIVTAGGVSGNNTNLVFRTAPNGNETERMRIDSSGHFLFNCTSIPSSSVAGAAFEKNGNTGVLFVSSGSSTASNNVAEFKNGNGTIGTININGSSTYYNNLSDYRLKENVVAISDGITRLKTLKPSKFNFKADKDTTVDGFLAHEVTAVPEAITGTKDETQDILYTENDTIPSGKKIGDVKEVKPIYQGIDQSKLVPLLTAALQEAITKIETLETKVAALEAK